MITEPCEPCLIKNESRIVFSGSNNCSDYRCNGNVVEIDRSINSHCLRTVDFFSYHVVNYRATFLISFILMAVFYFFLEVVRFSNKTSGEIKEVDFTEEYLKKEIIFLSLQGNNSIDNPWFLDLDIPKEFISFLNTRDYFTLSRVTPQRVNPP